MNNIGRQQLTFQLNKDNLLIWERILHKDFKLHEVKRTMGEIMSDIFSSIDKTQLVINKTLSQKAENSKKIKDLINLMYKIKEELHEKQDELYMLRMETRMLRRIPKTVINSSVTVETLSAWDEIVFEYPEHNQSDIFSAALQLYIEMEQDTADLEAADAADKQKTKPKKVRK